MLIIFPVIAADFRFKSAPLSFKALPYTSKRNIYWKSLTSFQADTKIGINRAKDGASIECINSHSNSDSNASLVLWAGSDSAANKIGLNRDISGFFITDEISISAAFAPSFTFG
jgi:hypothetical protein